MANIAEFLNGLTYEQLEEVRVDAINRRTLFSQAEIYHQFKVKVKPDQVY
jgi:hypothetical protein